nr:hypothetical protein [Tanacetum cinerariifolium]
QINQQKKIEEEAKAEAAKYKIEVRKEELVDLLGPEASPRSGLDDHAKTFSSLLLAEINKRNLNPLKQMGRLLGSVPEPFSLSVDLNIKSLSVSQAEIFQLESLKLLQRQLFRFLEDWEKLKRVVSLLEGLQGGKKIALCQKE